MPRRRDKCPGYALGAFLAKARHVTGSMQEDQEDSIRAPLNPLVVFTLDEQRYALRLHAVERIVRTVAVTPVPRAPEIVTGLINVEGQVVPVFDIRRRFCLPERRKNFSDQIIIAYASKRMVALVVDSVNGVEERQGEEVTTADEILPGLQYLEAVAKLDDGMILIHNLDQFLSLEEEGQLNGVVNESRHVKK